MTATSTVYEALPGLSVPLGQALEKLSAMWSGTDGADGRPHSEFRASRMNLVVHVGFEASATEAGELFQSVIAFSHRYPCRLILLCPQPDSWHSQARMSCKIFSECVIGSGAGGMSCCEALILGYTLSDRKFLEDQVSVFLEADLPTYYWPTRFGSARMLSDYQFFFKIAKRIVFDSSREPFLAEQIELPQKDKLHDLSFSRLLPIRQSMGQFLSGFPPSAIVDGLKEVAFGAPDCFRCEGRALMSWVEAALASCFPAEESAEGAFNLIPLQGSGADSSPKVRFIYDDERYFAFEIDLEKGEGRIEADLGNGPQSMTTGARLLDAENALAEALFFS